VKTDSEGIRRRENHSLPRGGRIQAPGDWGPLFGSDFFGAARFSRRFGLPTNLTPSDHVWLVVDGVDYYGAVELNGAALGSVVGYSEPTQFDITPMLRASNLLTIDIELPESGPGAPRLDRPDREALPGGLIGEVRLEIRS
jgi:hypothetical protein